MLPVPAYGSNTKLPGLTCSDSKAHFSTVTVASLDHALLLLKAGDGRVQVIMRRAADCSAFDQATWQHFAAGNSPAGPVLGT